MGPVRKGVRWALAGVAAACLSVAPLVAAAPAMAATMDRAVASERSFPGRSAVRRDLSRESVSTESTGDWGGVETLDVPRTESQAERDERAREQAALQARAQAQSAQRGTAGRNMERAAITPPASKNGQAIAEYAMQFNGYPYVYGGDQPTGWDCSGFVRYVYARFGVDLPHSSGAQMTVGTPVASLAEARPGDILANPSHAAIYIGNGMVMNAMSPAQGTGTAPVGTVMGASYAIRRLF